MHLRQPRQVHNVYGAFELTMKWLRRLQKLGIVDTFLEIHHTKHIFNMTLI